MLINIRHKKDLITVDLRTAQIRYCKNIDKKGLISFHSLSKDDIEGYEYLFNEDKKLFFKTLRSDLKEFMNKSITIKACEVLKWTYKKRMRAI